MLYPRMSQLNTQFEITKEEKTKKKKFGDNVVIMVKDKGPRRLRVPVSFSG